MLYSDLGQNFGSISPLFSKYTSRNRDCVSEEQWGRAAEILSRIGVEHGNRPQLRNLGLSKKRGQFETDTVIDMQRSAYLHPYLFRTGDA